MTWTVNEIATSGVNIYYTCPHFWPCYNSEMLIPLILSRTPRPPENLIKHGCLASSNRSWYDIMRNILIPFPIFRWPWINTDRNDSLSRLHQFQPPSVDFFLHVLSSFHHLCSVLSHLSRWISPWTNTSGKTQESLVGNEEAELASFLPLTIVTMPVNQSSDALECRYWAKGWLARSVQLHYMLTRGFMAPYIISFSGLVGQTQMYTEHANFQRTCSFNM
jgi:hypothetical protein